MNRKIVVVFTGVLLILFICLYVFIGNGEEKIVIASGKSDKSVISTNALTMMYETEAGSGEYVVTSESVWPQEGYVFNENLSSCENGGTLSWNNETKRVVMQTNSSDRCYVYFDKELEIIYLADYITSLYTTDGENGLYYHDGVGTYINADQEAGDNSYRYAGANPNNYVCFGSDAASCPDDNLYRIIGVFDGQIKLIKYDYATSALLGTNGDYYGQYEYRSLFCGRDDSEYVGSNYSNIEAYYWNFNGDNYANNDNTWSASKLNTINLNTNFLTNIGNKWADMIAINTWIVGGNTSSSLVSNVMNSNAKSAYNYEIINPATSANYNAKVGLMYVSDYYYGADPIYWSYPGWSLSGSNNDYRAARNNNWIYMGLFDWTITRDSISSNIIYSVSDVGRVIDYYYDDEGACGFGHSAVRPTFYLNSDVTYVGGSGTSTDPIRIN